MSFVAWSDWLLCGEGDQRGQSEVTQNLLPSQPQQPPQSTPGCITDPFELSLENLKAVDLELYNFLKLEHDSAHFHCHCLEVSSKVPLGYL